MYDLKQLLRATYDYCLQVLSYPVEPAARIFILYLASSLVFALAIYFISGSMRRDRQTGIGLWRGVLSFLFPKSVWSHPSAWVDVRFFFPHQLLRLWLYTDVMAVFAVMTHQFMLKGARTVSGKESIYDLPENYTWLIIGYAIFSIVLIDFFEFVMHYLQHKIPLLWEFHKVHHSSEVLHPLSNYREHPVDNFLYAVVTGGAAGMALSSFEFLFGAQPLALLVPILGIGVFAFAFNFLGYNLRHSHVWLRWPGFLAYLFGCPAHHQIHHSCKPQHINKNMAFMFPIWDILFGTYYLPDEKEEMTFGIGDGSESMYRSYLSIYWLPFKHAYHRLFGAAKSMDSSRPSASKQPKSPA